MKKKIRKRSFECSKKKEEERTQKLSLIYCKINLQESN